MDYKRLYLFSYNVLQSFGWAAALFVACFSLYPSFRGTHVFEKSGYLVGLFQGLSILETVHAATGLVGSGVAVSFVQWAGRSHVLFAILSALPQLQRSAAVGPLFLAWAASEVIRYPWYAATLLGRCPHALTWLRYTAFIPLYPVGVLAEVWIILEALPIAKESGMYSLRMPNWANFAFDYPMFLWALLAVYPFAWLQLYAQLLRSRSKKLAPPRPKEP
mmetsp:Transcript_29687/g.70752  ORF Transcript_29687/g.70752 Transcript_29687/m.70752 type:complete len:219 (+) Transcript_29687:48-704(+)